MEKEQKVEVWRMFKDWGREQGLSFEHEEDWRSFWETWSDGFKAGVRWTLEKKSKRS